MTRPWTDDEVAAMVKALRDGATYSDVAAMLGRTRGSIAGCIKRYTEGKEALPVSDRVSLLALKRGMCRWPIEEAPDLVGGYAFCAMPAKDEFAVYCSHHRRLAGVKVAA